MKFNLVTKFYLKTDGNSDGMIGYKIIWDLFNVTWSRPTTEESDEPDLDESTPLAQEAKVNE